MDQATKLRRLKESDQADAPHPHVLAVIGGAGGVGVSTMALLVGKAAAYRGVRTVLVAAENNDAGMLVSSGNAERVFDGPSSGDEENSRSSFSGTGLPEHLLPVSTDLFLFSPTGSGRSRLDDLSRQVRVAGAAGELVVVDVAGGYPRLIQEAVRHADALVVVTRPDTSDLICTYGALKDAHGALSRQIPWYLVFNQADDREFAQVAGRRFQQTSQRFLAWKPAAPPLIVPLTTIDVVDCVTSERWSRKRNPACAVADDLAVHLLKKNKYQKGLLPQLAESVGVSLPKVNAAPPAVLALPR